MLIYCLTEGCFRFSNGSILTPHPLAIHPRLADIAFITQGHQHEQLLINVMAAAYAQALQRGDRRVNHHKIRLFARLEIANFLLQPQGARPPRVA